MFLFVFNERIVELDEQQNTAGYHPRRVGLPCHNDTEQSTSAHQAMWKQRSPRKLIRHTSVHQFTLPSSLDLHFVAEIEIHVHV